MEKINNEREAQKGFYVGQTVYIKSISPSFCWTKETIKQATVTKVGRRYITVKPGYYEMQFDTQNKNLEKSVYSPAYQLFSTKGEIIDYWQLECLIYHIKKRFDAYSKDIDLATAMKIAGLLGIHINEEIKARGEIFD